VARLGRCGSSEEHLKRAKEAEFCISELGVSDKGGCTSRQAEVLREVL
jgi:hypothetical protein